VSEYEQGESECPSRLIDAAICKLLAEINCFSDSFFDAYWLSLTNGEVEMLVVNLIENLSENLNGQELQAILQKIREETSSPEDLDI